jgi:hypothetical protein
MSFKKMLLMPYEAIKNKRKVAQGYTRFDNNNNVNEDEYNDVRSTNDRTSLLQKKKKKRPQKGKGITKRRPATKKRRVSNKRSTNKKKLPKWLGL